MTDLSIVIINHDGREDSIRALDSLARIPSAISVQVILVDNCSTDGAVEEIQQVFPSVTTIVSPKRQGFSANANLGLRESHGQLVLLMNNDCVLLDDSIMHMVQVFRDEQVALAGPMLLDVSGNPQPDTFRDRFTMRDFILDELVFDAGLPHGKIWHKRKIANICRRKTGETKFLPGAFLMIRRKFYLECGLLDEEYSFCFEDLEYCMRARAAGLKVVYVAESRVCHVGHQTGHRVKVWTQQMKLKGALRFFMSQYRLGPVRTVVGWTLILVSIACYLQRAIAFGIAGFRRPRYFANARHYGHLVGWAMLQSRSLVSDFTTSHK